NGIAGTPAHWSFLLNLRPFNVTGSSLVLPGVPANLSVVISAPNLSPAYRQWEYPSVSVPTETHFTRNSTVFINYTTEFGFQLVGLQPSEPRYFEFFALFNNNFYFTSISCFLGFNGKQNCVSFTSPGWPWIFPAGLQIEFGTQIDDPVAWWNGTGPGSYNGTGQDLNLTIHGVVNESVWLGLVGNYTVSVGATGLPSGSVYSFTWDGVGYSAGANSEVSLGNVSTGPHLVHDVQANSSRPGWEYFGVPTPSNPVVVPAETAVNLSFAFVNVGTPEGAVAFHAVGLTAGTVWDLKFNGTVYSSSTPWINVTSHSGTFPVTGFPVDSENASVGFAPNIPSTLNVTAGQVYNLSFVPAYRIAVWASTGGSITGGGVSWLPSGASENFTATTEPGYRFVGWSGVGLGSFSGATDTAQITVGGPITELASFAPLPTARFNLTVVEQGLPTGTPWTVFVNGSGYSTTGFSLEVPHLRLCPIQYPVRLPAAFTNGTSDTRFLGIGVPSSTCTNGSSVLVVQFEPQYLLSLQMSPGGYAQVAVGLVQQTASIWVDSGASARITAFPDPGYDFQGWNGTGGGSYSGTASTQTLTVDNPITELASFAAPIPVPPPRFGASFHALQLPQGTTWTLAFNSTDYASSSPYINLSGFLSGNYPTAIGSSTSTDGLSRFLPIAPPAFLFLDRNRTVNVTFGAQYRVVVGNLSGGTVQPVDGWFPAGYQLRLVAVPAPGFVFLQWNGSGTDAYSGPLSNTTVSIAGPLTEYAVFDPEAAPPVNASSFWSTAGGLGSLGAIGLAAGLSVAWVVRRLRRANPSRPEAPEPQGPTENEDSGRTGEPQ
ncbi:MAG TPA: hypothetical protein VJS68_02530, partial [Thermoplasmata archaeon]|nr:hypothetical protein [Thermoplasmata archaeon]